MTSLFGQNQLIAKRHKIISPIGSGIFGELSLAEDLFLKRTVVIKSVKKSTLYKKRYLLHEKKTRFIASLSHPNIVNIYDFFIHDGVFIKVIQYIKGSNLDIWVNDNDPSLTQCVSIALDLVNALQYIHKQGIIHRSITPNNILIHHRNSADVSP